MREERKGIRLGILFFCLMTAGLLLRGNLQVKASVLTDVQWMQGSSITLYQDITGDGVKDSIQVKATKSNEYYYKNVSVYINGALALTEKIDGCSGVSARFLSCSAKKNYLQVEATADGGYMYLNRIYAYSGKKLVRAADFGQEDNMSATVTKVTAKSVVVKFSVQPWETGRVEWNFVYQPKSKKLKLKNNTVKVVSVLGQWDMNDGYQKYFKQNKFVTQNGRAFYTSTNMKKKAFTTKQGDVLKLQKVKMIGRKMYLRFKKGKKTGWQKVNGTYSSNYWFYGVVNRLAG